MLPFKLTPAYKDYLWGGTKLKSLYNKQTDTDPLAESWELSAHPDGGSEIATGEWQGMSLAQFLAEHPTAAGAHCAPGDEFPVLIKMIDAARPLSVQVHPGDEYAAREEGGARGKTEMWLVLDAEPDAFVYFGFEEQTGPEAVRRAVADGSITGLLHAAPATPGEVFFIPAGTVHALGEGILVAEVQQSSNLTYRLYDYGRTGPDGKPRPLHLDKALDVADFGPAGYRAPGAALLADGEAYRLERLAACPYFQTARLSLHGACPLARGSESFLSLLCLAGGATLTTEGCGLEIATGDSVFLPAGNEPATLDGEGSFLLTGV